MSTSARDSRWVQQWTELFVDLSDRQVRGIVSAVDSNVLDGWMPQRHDIEFLCHSARGEFDEADEVAIAVTYSRRSSHRRSH